jgi:prephenate dehydrogenase
MKATIIGLGLIGGSMAIDLRKAGLVSEIFGIDINPQHTEKGLLLRLID